MPEFLDLPPELRDEIYFFVVEWLLEEHEWKKVIKIEEFEVVGVGCNWSIQYTEEHKEYAPTLYRITA